MEVTYADHQTEKICTDARAAQKSLGRERAKPLEVRVAQLRAATSAADLLVPGVPGRWELLTGDRRGDISGRLTGNWRIIVRPLGGTEDLGECVEVIVVEIVDYHRRA